MDTIGKLGALSLEVLAEVRYLQRRGAFDGKVQFASTSTLRFAAIGQALEIAANGTAA